MTEPTSPAGRRTRRDFDTAVLSGTETPASAPDLLPPRVPSRRWLLPALTAALVVLGGSALIAAALAPSGDAPASAAKTTAIAPSETPGPAPTVTTSREAATSTKNISISELADPDWVSRIAKAGDIPERALAAYAGAALSVAQTDPSCKIGWNTLAAIGQVESGHGTINGSRLDDRGVATPTIIGIALDGKDTAAVPDTDQGRYDGDTQWDRAVGPMQFIPSTWAQAGQDGNKDGAKDINQIDDAALAAAMHLCDIGGDLTIGQNWINAISAYNDSVDYNNKVAEAASRYATLR